MKQFSKFLSVVAFVVGNTVGGGILALPIVAGRSGFLPAILACIITALMMLMSGVFLLKAFWQNGRILTFSSIYEYHFGIIGKRVFEAFFLFLFLCLLTAYLSGMTDTLVTFLPISHRIALWFVVFLFGFLLVKGLRSTLLSNNFLMIGLLFVFCFIVIASVPGIKNGHLKWVEWKFFPYIFPVFLCSYGFHNTLPIVLQLTQNNYYFARNVVIVSSVITFGINFFFLWLVMGNLPLNGSPSILEAFAKGLPATVPLSQQLGSPAFVLAGSVFAFLAIATSYLAVGESIIKFIEPYKLKKWIVFGIVLGIPLVITFTTQHLFLKALDLGAGIGCNIIFGVLPGYMYLKKANTIVQRFFALLVILLFTAVLIIELNSRLFG